MMSVKASGVSIHALLAESDVCTESPAARPYVSIHALLAESDISYDPPVHAARVFQSTPSLRRATIHICGHALVPRVSIHALLAESDIADDILDKAEAVSIHALLAESDSPNRFMRP